MYPLLPFYVKLFIPYWQCPSPFHSIFCHYRSVNIRFCVITMARRSTRQAVLLPALQWSRCFLDIFSWIEENSTAWKCWYCAFLVLLISSYFKRKGYIRRAWHKCKVVNDLLSTNKTNVVKLVLTNFNLLCEKRSVTILSWNEQWQKNKPCDRSIALRKLSAYVSCTIIIWCSALLQDIYQL